MKRAAVAALMIPIAAVSIAACQNQPPSRDTQMATSSDTSIPGPKDPYSTNGCWKIPDDIKPGRYELKANTQDVVSLRWWSLDTDAYCQHKVDGADAANQGYHDMGYVTEGEGPMYLVIPSDGSVKAFENNGVQLRLVQE